MVIVNISEAPLLRRPERGARVLPTSWLRLVLRGLEPRDLQRRVLAGLAV